MVAEGTIPCTKVTGRWLFPKAALDRCVSSGMANPLKTLEEAAPPIAGGSTDPLLEWALRESGSGLASLPEGSEAGLRRLGRREVILAAISSGSYPTDGMVVIPCSMKTLAGIRAGYADGLVGRAADVVLKERRKLVLVPRETPLSEIHLENMLALSRMGVVMVPPMPAFYNHPGSVDDVVNHVVARVLDQFGLPAPQARRWSGLGDARRDRS